ncbi:MAG: pyrimidine-nucleoside phosphorylase [Acholeplasmataceae bacterium]|nr:pyrimidine-nucleoside phosphorylase [Acholeplasmataceae bacterium]
MRMLDLIIKKRDNLELSKEEINFIIKAYTEKKIPDYQMSSLLMAIYFNGMTDRESTYLALAMKESGDSFDLSAIKGIKVDKHSTGGVGDKVTLVLGPLMAACGAKFAKMSGRGLGHTGGTLDKLESIKGYNLELSEEEFVNQVNEIGIAVIGQSGDIAPADKLLYALRDVTGTVPSIPLIASSIMSKKLASGADVVVLDVKVGSGAFMESIEEARKLASLMVNIGTLAGMKVYAVITSMDEPLGYKIGNTLEVIETIDALNGKGPKDLMEVTFKIGELLLEASGIAKGDDAIKLMKEKIENKEALNKLIKLVKAQGGDVSYIKDYDNFPKAKNIIPFKALKDGYIEAMDTEKIGIAAMVLGAGRERKDDIIDFTVGLDFKKKIGDYVKKDDVVCYLHANLIGVDESLKLLEEAIKIGNKKRKHILIKEIIK